MTKVGRRKEGQRPDNVTLDLKVHKHIKEAMSTNKYIDILCYHNTVLLNCSAALSKRLRL